MVLGAFFFSFPQWKKSEAILIMPFSETIFISHAKCLFRPLENIWKVRTEAELMTLPLATERIHRETGLDFNIPQISVPYSLLQSSAS